MCLDQQRREPLAQRFILKAAQPVTGSEPGGDDKDCSPRIVGYFWLSTNDKAK